MSHTKFLSSFSIKSLSNPIPVTDLQLTRIQRIQSMNHTAPSIKERTRKTQDTIGLNFLLFSLFTKGFPYVEEVI